MTEAEIDNLLADKLMKWTHVTTDNMSETDETVFMFWKNTTVLRGRAYDATERFPLAERRAFVKKHKARYDHKFDSWSPTRNVEDAFEIVEQLRKTFSNFALCRDNGWSAEFWHINVKGKNTKRIRGQGETPAQAISAAARAFIQIVEPLTTKKRKS